MRGAGRQRATRTTPVTLRPDAPSSWRPTAVFLDFGGTLRTAWMVDDGADSDPGNIVPDLVVRRHAEVTYLVGVEVGR